MELWGDFWSMISWFFWAYVYIAYLFAIVIVLGDVFKDRALNGWLKALWVILLVFLPFLTVVIYLIARGAGLSERMGRGLNAPGTDTPGSSGNEQQVGSAAEVAKAHGLLRAGAISQEEFEVLKDKALS